MSRSHTRKRVHKTQSIKNSDTNTDKIGYNKLNANKKKKLANN